jgi:hypothetical protein
MERPAEVPSDLRGTHSLISNESAERLTELLAEKDRIIAALRAELIDHMDDPPDGDDAKFYKAVDEYIDRVIEQARSGK